MQMSTSGMIYAGIELIQRGWIQGSLLHDASAPKVYTVQGLVKQENIENIEADVSPSSNQWEVKEVVLDKNDLLVIVSQACDIQKAPDKEPYMRGSTCLLDKRS